MSIIQKEIEKRIKLIEEQKEAISMAAKLRQEAQEKELFAASIDEKDLQAEIEELKGYLPVPAVEV